MSAGSPSRRHPDWSDAGRPPWTFPVARLDRKARYTLLAVALVLVGVLGVARWLRPDPKGFGTHQQLGLLPCAFRTMTGYGCPSCGMTTAFAWFARGKPAESWGANPAGLVLAITCAILAPWMLVAAATGRAWGVRSLDRPAMMLFIGLVGLTLIFWVARMIL